MKPLVKRFIAFKYANCHTFSNLENAVIQIKHYYLANKESLLL